MNDIGVNLKRIRLLKDLSLQEAGKLLKIQKSTESVQVNEKVQKSEKSVQKNTDLLQTESTEKSEKITENIESVQNLSNKEGITFEF